MCERGRAAGKWLEEKRRRREKCALIAARLQKGPPVKSSETEKIGLIKDLNDP